MNFLLHKSCSKFHFRNKMNNHYRRYSVIGKELIHQEIIRQKHVLESVPLISEEQFLQNTPFYMRPYVRYRIKKVKAKEKRHNIDIAKSVFEGSLFARILLTEDFVLRSSATGLFEKIIAHIEELKPFLQENHLYLEKSGYFEIEFCLTLLPFWIILRRFRDLDVSVMKEIEYPNNKKKDGKTWRGDEGYELNRLLLEILWRHSDRKIFEVEVLDYQTRISMEQIHQLVYGTLGLLDEAYDHQLEQKGDSDALFSNILYMLLYQNNEETTAADIFFWLKYLRFHLALLMTLDIGDLMASKFLFLPPKHKLIQTLQN